MASALSRKSWTDLTRRPARTVLTTLTLALAVASFGILALPTLTNRAMSSEVAQSRLYDVSIPIDTVSLSADQMEDLARLPNVAAVTGRTTFTTRTEIGARRVDTEVWGVPDFATQPVDRVATSARPGSNQVLVDVRDSMSKISNAKAGDVLNVQSADGSFRSLEVAGSARAMAFNQDTMSGRLVLYVDQPTVQNLRGMRGVNLLELRLADNRASAAQATVAAVRSFLAGQPTPTTFSAVPTIRAAGDWPLKSVFNSRLKILDILIALAVLSAVFLLTNTIRTLVAEQTREIGVMRSIGASARDVRNSYLRTAAVLGALGSAAGALMGVGLSAQQGGSLYTPALVDTVRSQPGVAGVEAASWSDMTYQGQTLPGLGVHPATFVRETLKAGRWLTAEDERSQADVAVVGSAAARRWHLRPGSQITVTTAGGPVTFAVVGVGRSQANNGYNLYTTLAAIQAATRHPDVANSLFIRAADTHHAAIDALAARLEAVLASSGHPSRSQLIYAGRATDKASAASLLVIVEGVGLLIVAISMLGLVNAITMSILERTREVGVLRCLGARARELRRIFRIETLTLALIGFGAAVPLGWGVAHALQWLVLHLAGGQLPAPYTLRNLGIALIGTIVLALAVVIVPLRRATHLHPGDAIRYN